MPSEKDKVELVQNLLSYAREGIAPKRRKWLERYRYWRAQEIIKRPQYKDNVRIPLIFMISDGIQAVLTDSRPKISFLPQENNDIETADALNQIVGDYYWDVLKLFRASEDIIWWALNISGSGIAKYGIDPETNKFYLKPCNSFACYPDPTGDSLETLEFFIYSTPISIPNLKRIYGERAKNVTEQPELDTVAWDEDEILSPWARTSWKSENLIGIMHENDVFAKRYGRTMMHECWVKDDQMIKIVVPEGEIENEHELFRQYPITEQSQSPTIEINQNHPEHIKAHKEFVTNATQNPDIPSEVINTVLDHIEEHMFQPDAEKTRQLKYPKGKILTIANSILLSEQAAPFGLNYIKMDCIINPREFWASTIQEYVQSLQDSRVRRKRQISDNADMMANLREFYNVYAVDDYENKVKNVPGESVPTRGDPRAAVYVPAVPSLGQYVLEDALDSERLVEKITGYPEALQGKYPTGSPSGIAMAELIEAMAPRIRKIGRHYEWWLEDWARAMIQMLPYERREKIYAILGKGKKPTYIRLDDLNIQGEFDIRLMTGSTMPTSRMAKEERALKLFQSRLYDEEAALEYLDDPQKEKILERKSIVKEQQRIIEALMQQNEILKGQENGQKTPEVSEFSPEQEESNYIPTETY